MLLKDVDREKISPMMKQYCDIRDKYSDYILFFRLGDFYEMFFDDAITVSRALELTLTGRDCGLEERAPMCGVPFHSADVYTRKLIDLGYKVAICEQLTDPNETKGIVVRDVVKIITPGTLIEGSMLDDSVNNYICCAYLKDGACALCCADISTGDASVTEVPAGKELEAEIINILSRYRPSEILFNSDFLSLKNVSEFIKNRLECSYSVRPDECFDTALKEETVTKQFSVSSYSGIYLEADDIRTSAVCGLFDYFYETQRSLTGRFTEMKLVADDAFMGLDLSARRNLELCETLRNKEKRGSLLWVLDSTKTSMGKRLLRSYIEQPLLSPARIIDRLNAVDALVKNPVVLMELQDMLNRVYDIERLMTRVMYRTATPRDLKALALTSLELPGIKEQLRQVASSKLLAALEKDIFVLDEISNLIENSIVDDPPVTVRDGGVIRDGFNEKLDELRSVISGGNDIITKIEEREKERTGIKGLKTGYNRVFGYYLEVTRSYYHLVPDDYIRKQTLTNCERFITQELKNAENTIIGARDKVLVLENDIFSEVRDFVASKLGDVQKTASALAAVDVMCSFASVAVANRYTRPDISADGVIEIKDGRHPVVELMLGDEVFVPNDTYIDIKSNRMSVITGPNMSGKSTYMRQVALISLMAQMGSFVPASYARLSVVDKIFTRIGASDDLTAGQSTFMVEMSEVADILKHATKQSLVILDEVGRGTSTFDGISIARSVAEHICSSRSLGCKTLFATHYHELIGLENEMEGVKNYSVAVKKHGEDIRFLRKIVPGGVDDSYGIEVARLAGVPQKVITRARELLRELEQNSENHKNTSESSDIQMSFDHMTNENALDRLRKTNISELSDAECRELLEDMHRMIK
ncbi:MAG: DNA mismatch repair protein MutS [Oscillospiraceae bacterium]|nr:DNA mismatch repair protein MutS [Oscillospiraceae bacterium]